MYLTNGYVIVIVIYNNGVQSRRELIKELNRQEFADLNQDLHLPTLLKKPKYKS